jgi:PAS domain S-box-containing protein
MESWNWIPPREQSSALNLKRRNTGSKSSYLLLGPFLNSLLRDYDINDGAYQGDMLNGEIGMSTGEQSKEQLLNELEELQKRIDRLTEENQRLKDDNQYLISLADSEEIFLKIFNNANDAIFLHKLSEDGVSGNFMEINSVASEILGYTREELLQMAPPDVVDWKSFPGTSHQDDWDKPSKITFETFLIAKDGGRIPVEINTHIFTFNHEKLSLSIARDITERKKMEDELRISLEEKEMLLREIHHRVKNNLMIISSLLNLQSRYIKDKQVLDVFKDSQNRARSMALIHDRLYQSSHLKRIDIGDYIQTLAGDLFRTYATDSARIKLNFDIEEVMVDINTMIPLGLIVNELLSNSLKHAFPGEREGHIDIGFHSYDHSYHLTVSDNGVGFPEDINYQDTKSLGLRLVNILTDQIDGTIELKREAGTKFIIEFKEKQYR